jgi:hypothetical protein
MPLVNGIQITYPRPHFLLYMVLFDPWMHNNYYDTITAVPASFGSETPGKPPPQGHPFNPVSTVLSLLPLQYSV